MGGVDNGCGSGLLGVAPANRLHCLDRTLLAFWTYGKPFGKCNYYIYMYCTCATNSLSMNALMERNPVGAYK